MKKLQLLILLLFTGGTLVAQPVNLSESPPVNNVHSLGVAASMMSAPAGVSYQYSFDNKNRIEATGFPVYYEYQNEDNPTKNNKDIAVTFGLEYHHLILQSRNTKLYYMVGLGFIFSEIYNSKYIDDKYLMNPVSLERILLSGSGLVLEFHHKSFSWNFDFGYSYWVGNERGHDENYLTFTKSFKIAIGAGIYYNF